MNSFWLWLYSVVKKYRDNVLREKHGCSVKCPWCNTWSWETDGVQQWVYNETGDRVTMVCKKCTRESRWGTDHALPYCLTNPDKPNELELLKKLAEGAYYEGWEDGMGNRSLSECWDSSQTRHCLEHGFEGGQ